MNAQLIIDRIRARLEQLSESSFDVSEAIGKNRNFLNDLMVGRKKSFSADMLPAIAGALRCDVAYLLAMQDEPIMTGESSLIPVAGSVEPGVWRKVARDPSLGRRVPMRPDPRHPAALQKLWLVRGDTLDGIDVRDGSAVLTVGLADQSEWFNLLVDNDLVVAEKHRDGDAMRTLLRVRRDAAGIEFVADGGDLDPVLWKSPTDRVDHLQLVGLVLQVIRFRV